jgi:hypothetical protein
VHMPFTLRKSQRSFCGSKSAFWKQGGINIFGHYGVISKFVPDINPTFRTKSELGTNSRYGFIATDYLELLKDSNLNISIDWNTCQHPLNLKGMIVNLRWRPTCSMLGILPQKDFELN